MRVFTPLVSVGMALFLTGALPAQNPPQQPSVMIARLSVRNTTADLVTLTFNTGQIYDLEIRNEKGEQVFLWSKGRLFAQMVQSITLASGEKNHMITVPIAFAPGKYIVQAWLVAGPPKAYSASAAFEIQ